MASKLQCEICGGKLVGKPGGIFECENCGTEYSTEWAKAKIQEITGTVKVEGTVQVQGTVKVENGGPSAESLVKRGMIALGEVRSVNGLTLIKQKRTEVKNLFDRALEIDPENAAAYWGKFLLEQTPFLYSTEDAIRRATDLVEVDKNINYLHAREYAKGDLAEAIQHFDDIWSQANQSRMLPEGLRHSHIIQNGTLKGIKTHLMNAKTVTIPSCVSTIGDRAFSSCRDLKSVKIPESVHSINESAFSYCSGLTSIMIPRSVFWIGDNAFDNCESLTSLTIPEGVYHIGKSAFAYCKELKSVIIPSSVAEIGRWAFSKCTSLTTVELSEREPQVIETTDDESEPAQGATVKLESGVFDGCENLVSVTLPDNVTEIGRMAFYNCPNVTIRAHENSYAAEYALENGILFERIPSREEIEAEKRARIERISELKNEKAKLQEELPTLKGMFAGLRKSRIEARLAEIEAELKKLG